MMMIVVIIRAEIIIRCFALIDITHDRFCVVYKGQGVFVSRLLASHGLPRGTFLLQGQLI